MDGLIGSGVHTELVAMKDNFGGFRSECIEYEAVEGSLFDFCHLYFSTNLNLSFFITLIH